MDADFGQPLPRGMEHAVSVSIPHWDQMIAFLEKDPDVVSKMNHGYPRYFLQAPLKELGKYFQCGSNTGNDACWPFASRKAAYRCLKYVKRFKEGEVFSKIETLSINLSKESDTTGGRKNCVTIAAVLAPEEENELVQEYWKLSGEMVSSRMATFFNEILDGGSSSSEYFKDFEMEESIKRKLKNRIADNYNENEGEQPVKIDSQHDVSLLPNGLATIFTTHRMITAYEDSQSRSEGNEAPWAATSVVFGFPFRDTKIALQRLGPLHFLGYGDSDDLDKLERLLSEDANVGSIFVETPSNPVLKMPDMRRLKRIADSHDVLVIVDDTIAGLNLNILPYADIVCTSLTKLFSGASNVMGGSIVVNPRSRIHSFAQEYLRAYESEDMMWCQDAKVLEENSRDYAERNKTANRNTESLIKKVIQAEQGKLFKEVFYPMLDFGETKDNFDALKRQEAGYGSLFSLTFFDERTARCFYDNLKVHKGPSLGTNFTLAIPFSLLAYYNELEDVAKYGISRNLVRISVGLEIEQYLINAFTTAIIEAKKVA